MSLIASSKVAVYFSMSTSISISIYHLSKSRKSKNKTKLLGLNIGCLLNFDYQVEPLCKKASKKS